MSKQPKPDAAEAKHDRDLATFKRLPENTKEMMKLKDRHEKATGPAQVAANRKIANRTKESQS